MLERKKKIQSEMESRKGILSTAKKLGCEEEVIRLFYKYDSLLNNNNLSELERKQISIMAIVDLHNLIDCSGALVINGEEIIPGEPDQDLGETKDGIILL